MCIRDSGVIVVNSDNASAFRLGEFNRTENAGRMDILGTQALGVQAGDFSEISNTGTLNVAGDAANGIAGNRELTIENSGEITVSGEGAWGAAVAVDSLISNTGTVTVSGAGSTGLEVGARSATVNELGGTMVIEAPAVDAVALRGKSGANAVVNQGTITSSADSSTAIFVEDSVTQGLNSGTIDLSADDATGMRGGAGSRVINDAEATLQIQGANAIGLSAQRGGQASNSGTITPVSYTHLTLPTKA